MRYSCFAVAACVLFLGCRASSPSDDASFEDKLVVSNIHELQRFWPQIDVPESPRERMMTPAELKAMIDEAEEEAREACRLAVFGVEYMPPAEETTHRQLLNYIECLKSSGLL